jgi:ferredoxin
VECFYEVDPGGPRDQMLYIHPEECIDCEACVPECPVEAIFHEDNVPEEWVPFVELNVELSTGSEAVVVTEKKDPLCD